MRFTIEQRHLTDQSGRPAPGPAIFHTCDAPTVEEAVAALVEGLGAELIGNVLKFPGFQGVATVRDASGVSTLQIAPATGRLQPAL